MIKKISWIVYGSLFALLTGFYFNHYFIVNNFHWLRFVIYIGIPLLINLFILKIPLSELGLGKWRWNRMAKKFFYMILAVAPLLFLMLPLFTSYLEAYPQYQSSSMAFSDKALRFGIFTLSTLPAWEFLHRGFMLFGIQQILNKSKVEESLSSGLAILFVVASETLYHLIKPDLEAYGMLIFSPILCWFALKTKSIWAALLLHVYIEALFFIQISGIL